MLRSYDYICLCGHLYVPFGKEDWLHYDVQEGIHSCVRSHGEQSPVPRPASRDSRGRESFRERRLDELFSLRRTFHRQGR